MTHETVGLSAGLVTASLVDLSIADTAALTAGALAGSWLPDVDQIGSRIHRQTALERRTPIAKAMFLPYRSALLLIGLLVPHRGPTHSLLVAMVATVAALLVIPGWVLPAGLAIGWIAHLLLDACTPSGVQLFWPVLTRRVYVLPRRFRVRTGSSAELVLLAVVTASVTGSLLLVGDGVAALLPAAYCSGGAILRLGRPRAAAPRSSFT